MTSITIGVIGIVLLLVLLTIRVPVAFAMAMVGFAGFSYLVSPSAGLSILAIEVFENFNSYSLSVVPSFVLMGSIVFAAKITGRLYDAGYTIFGRMRGGLAMASIASCAAFAAICGSTSATVAAMCKVAMPEMKRYKYDDSLATGCIASAGSLGILIPPSTILILYGIMTEQSIGKLFVAGILPGIMIALLFMLVVFVQCWKNPAIGPAGPSTNLKRKLTGVLGLLEAFVLFALVIGGMLTGWFTPTQAGSAGAGLALLIAIVRRSINVKDLISAFQDTIIITSMVMMIVTGAIVFSRFIAMTKIPFFLAAWISGLDISPIFIMAIIVIVHFIGGCFMDAFGLIVLSVPIVFPVVVALGFDPIWFGVLIVLIVEMGVVTPPVGINVYVIKGVVPDVDMGKIFRGVIPFVGALAVGIILLMLFPEIVTFLPNQISY